MATKSFVTEFKFTTKSGTKLLNAIESSTTREHVIEKPVTLVKDEKAINSIIDSFVRKESK